MIIKIHEGAFRLFESKDMLATYQFHTNAAHHYFCKKCGIYPFHRKRVAPDYFGVNLFCLEDFEPAGISVRATADGGTQ